MPGVEKRQDVDGSYYTKEEFIAFYTGLDEWDQAEAEEQEEETASPSGFGFTSPVKSADGFQFSMGKVSTLGVTESGDAAPMFGDVTSSIFKTSTAAPVEWTVPATVTPKYEFQVNANTTASSPAAPPSEDTDTAAHSSVPIPPDLNKADWVCSTCGRGKDLTGDHLKTKQSVNSQCNSKKCSFKKRTFVRKGSPEDPGANKQKEPKNEEMKKEGLNKEEPKKEEIKKEEPKKEEPKKEEPKKEEPKKEEPKEEASPTKGLFGGITTTFATDSDGKENVFSGISTAFNATIPSFGSPATPASPVAGGEGPPPETKIPDATDSNQWMCSTCGAVKILEGAHLAKKQEVNTSCSSKKCCQKKRTFRRKVVDSSDKATTAPSPAVPKTTMSNPFATPLSGTPATTSGTNVFGGASSTNPFSNVSVPAPAPATAGSESNPFATSASNPFSSTAAAAFQSNSSVGNPFGAPPKPFASSNPFGTSANNVFSTGGIKSFAEAMETFGDASPPKQGFGFNEAAAKSPPVAPAKSSDAAPVKLPAEEDAGKLMHPKIPAGFKPTDRVKEYLSAGQVVSLLPPRLPKGWGYKDVAMTVCVTLRGTLKQGKYLTPEQCGVLKKVIKKPTDSDAFDVDREGDWICQNCNKAKEFTKTSHLVGKKSVNSKCDECGKKGDILWTPSKFGKNKGNYTTFVYEEPEESLTPGFSLAGADSAKTDSGATFGTSTWDASAFCGGLSNTGGFGTASGGFGTASGGFSTGGFGTASSGFGTASGGFGTASGGLSGGFGTASSGFGTASGGFGTASSGFGTASSGFGTASGGFGTASGGLSGGFGTASGCFGTASGGLSGGFGTASGGLSGGFGTASGGLSGGFGTASGCFGTASGGLSGGFGTASGGLSGGFGTASGGLSGGFGTASGCFGTASGGFGTASGGLSGGFGTASGGLSGGFGTASSGFGTASGGLSGGFGTASGCFGTASSGFGTASGGFGTASGGFGTPSNGFGTPSGGFSTTMGGAAVNTAGFPPFTTGTLGFDTAKKDEEKPSETKAANKPALYNKDLDEGVAYEPGVAGDFLCTRCKNKKEIKNPERFKGRVSLTSDCKTCVRSVTFKWTPSSGTSAAPVAVENVPSPMKLISASTPSDSAPTKCPDLPELVALDTVENGLASSFISVPAANNLSSQPFGLSSPASTCTGFSLSNNQQEAKPAETTAASKPALYNKDLDEGVAYEPGVAGDFLCTRCKNKKEMKNPDRFKGRVSLTSDCKTCVRSVTFKWTPSSGTSAAPVAVEKPKSVEPTFSGFSGSSAASTLSFANTNTFTGVSSTPAFVNNTPMFHTGLKKEEPKKEQPAETKAANKPALYNKDLDEGVAYEPGVAGDFLCTRCKNKKEMKNPDRFKGRVSLTSDCKTCARSVTFKWTPSSGTSAAPVAVENAPKSPVKSVSAAPALVEKSMSPMKPAFSSGASPSAAPVAMPTFSGFGNSSSSPSLDLNAPSVATKTPTMSALTTPAASPEKVTTTPAKSAPTTPAASPEKETKTPAMSAVATPVASPEKVAPVKADTPQKEVVRETAPQVVPPPTVVTPVVVAPTVDLSKIENAMLQLTEAYQKQGKEYLELRVRVDKNEKKHEDYKRKQKEKKKKERETRGAMMQLLLTQIRESNDMYRRQIELQGQQEEERKKIEAAREDKPQTRVPVRRAPLSLPEDPRVRIEQLEAECRINEDALWRGLTGSRTCSAVTRVVAYFVQSMTTAAQRLRSDLENARDVSQLTVAKRQLREVAKTDMESLDRQLSALIGCVPQTEEELANIGLLNLKSLIRDKVQNLRDLLVGIEYRSQGKVPVASMQQPTLQLSVAKSPFQPSVSPAHMITSPYTADEASVARKLSLGRLASAETDMLAASPAVTPNPRGKKGYTLTPSAGGTSRMKGDLLEILRQTGLDPMTSILEANGVYDVATLQSCTKRDLERIGFNLGQATNLMKKIRPQQVRVERSHDLLPSPVEPAYLEKPREEKKLPESTPVKSFSSFTPSEAPKADKTEVTPAKFCDKKVPDATPPTGFGSGFSSTPAFGFGGSTEKDSKAPPPKLEEKEVKKKFGVKEREKEEITSSFSASPATSSKGFGGAFGVSSSKTDSDKPTVKVESRGFSGFGGKWKTFAATSKGDASPSKDTKKDGDSKGFSVASSTSGSTGFGGFGAKVNEPASKGFGEKEEGESKGFGKGFGSTKPKGLGDFGSSTAGFGASSKAAKESDSRGFGGFGSSPPSVGFGATPSKDAKEDDKGSEAFGTTPAKDTKEKEEPKGFGLSVSPPASAGGFGAFSATPEKTPGFGTSSSGKSTAFGASSGTQFGASSSSTASSAGFGASSSSTASSSGFGASSSSAASFSGFGASSSTGFGASSSGASNGGFGASSSAAPAFASSSEASSSGFGAGGFGAASSSASPAAGFGAASSGGFGASSSAAGFGDATSGGFGASSSSATGFGAASSGGFGASPSVGFGTASSGSFGASSSSAGFGAASSGGFGASSSAGFGAASSGGFGASSSAGFGAASSGGFGASPAAGFGAASSGGFAAASSAGGFGAAPVPGFGAASPTPGFGAAAAAADNPFAGSGPGAGFGAPSPVMGGFGASASAPAPAGSNPFAGGGGFGATAAPAPAPGGFGAPATGFAQPAAAGAFTPDTSNPFASAPAAQAFGAPAPAPMPAVAPGGGFSQYSSAPSGFGQAAVAPVAAAAPVDPSNPFASGFSSNSGFTSTSFSAMRK